MGEFTEDGNQILEEKNLDSTWVCDEEHNIQFECIDSKMHGSASKTSLLALLTEKAFDKVKHKVLEECLLEKATENIIIKSEWIKYVEDLCRRT